MKPVDLFFIPNLLGSTMVYDNLKRKLEKDFKNTINCYHTELINKIKNKKKIIPELIEVLAKEIKEKQIFKNIVLFAYGDASIIAVKLQEYLLEKKILLKENIKIFAINSFLEIREDDFEPIKITIENILKSAITKLKGSKVTDYNTIFIENIRSIYPDIEKCREYFEKLKVEDILLDYIRIRFVTYTFYYIKGLLEIKHLIIPDNLSLVVDKDMFNRKLSFGISMGIDNIDDFFFKVKTKKKKLFYYNKKVSIDIFDKDFYLFLFKTLFCGY